jgi:hypothetical protein
MNVNTASQKFDGIDCVLDDGTVVLDPGNVEQLRKILGDCAARISLAEVETQAAELVRRYQAFAEKRGQI